VTAARPAVPPSLSVAGHGCLQVLTWRLPFSELNTFQVSPLQRYWICQLLTLVPHSSSILVMPMVYAHVYVLLIWLQIITVVQRDGGDSLAVPPADQLPAGPFPGLQDYVTLMRACRADDPLQRPPFGMIVQRLG
jgi:hypothetical protein